MKKSLSLYARILFHLLHFLSRFTLKCNKMSLKSLKICYKTVKNESKIVREDHPLSPELPFYSLCLLSLGGTTVLSAYHSTIPQPTCQQNRDWVRLATSAPPNEWPLAATSKGVGAVDRAAEKNSLACVMTKKPLCAVVTTFNLRSGGGKDVF